MAPRRVIVGRRNVAGAEGAGYVMVDTLTKVRPPVGAHSGAVQSPTVRGTAPGHGCKRYVRAAAGRRTRSRAAVARGPAIATSATAPAAVSRVLMPIRNPASEAAETAVPVAGAKPAASIAAEAPNEAGASGTSRPPLCASITSSTAATPAGRWKAARKQAIAAPRSRREAS